MFSATNVHRTKNPELYLGQSPDSSSVNPRTQVLPDLGLDLNINLLMKYPFVRTKSGLSFSSEFKKMFYQEQL